MSVCACLNEILYINVYKISLDIYVCVCVCVCVYKSLLICWYVSVCFKCLFGVSAYACICVCMCNCACECM